MRGLMQELMYPNQVVNINAVSPGYQPKLNLMQMAFSILQVKKGTQQNKNTAEKLEKNISRTSQSQFFQLVNFFLSSIRGCPIQHIQGNSYRISSNFLVLSNLSYYEKITYREQWLKFVLLFVPFVLKVFLYVISMEVMLYSLLALPLSCCYFGFF